MLQGVHRHGLLIRQPGDLRVRVVARGGHDPRPDPRQRPGVTGPLESEPSSVVDHQTGFAAEADVARDAHHARAYAATQSMWIADEGVQVLGGHGFIREHPVEMWYRNARSISVLEGTLAL